MEHTLDHKLETHPLKPALDGLVKHEEEVRERIRAITKKLAEVRKPKIGASANAQERARQIVANMEADLSLRQRMQSSLKARMYALQMEMLRDVISKADVVRSFPRSLCTRLNCA